MDVLDETSAGWRRCAATLLPVAVPLAMKAVFGATTRRFGPRRGYQAGFAIYWGTCWAAAATIVGPRRLPELWRSPHVALPTPGVVGAGVLLLPPLGALAVELVPHARQAGPVALVVAAGIGITNALAEETLWRGVPLAVFPGDRLKGWLWPAVGFTAWHLVPLSARPSGAGRRLSVLGGAAAIGLGYGWIAQRTGSLAFVTPAHALADSCGVRTVREIWMGTGAVRG